MKFWSSKTVWFTMQSMKKLWFFFTNVYNVKYILSGTYLCPNFIKIKNQIKSAFGNKHLKLDMSDGRSSFSYSIPFLHRNSVGDYIKWFFLPIGKYFKENS